MANGPKHCWNLHECTLIKFIDHCEGYWVGKSLLVICKILGLFVNTLNSDDKYSVLNRENLTQSETVSDLFSQFYKSRLIFKHSKTKNRLAS